VDPLSPPGRVGGLHRRASAGAASRWRRPGLLASWRGSLPLRRRGTHRCAGARVGWVVSRRSGDLARAEAAVGLLNAATSLRAS
jgi:hypothetical protein